MFGNFFNRMYSGKNRSDFTEDQLPNNRFALFFDMLKIRFFKLIQLNLMFLIFLLPLIFFLWSFVMYLQIETDAELVMQMLKQTLVFCIPCFGIAGIGMTGIVYIARNWARDEHAWVWSDYIDTIKTNWKQGLILGLGNGLLIAVMVNAGIFYAVNTHINSWFYALGWTMVVLLAVLAMINIYIWPMIITYDLKLTQQIKNAVVLALGRLPFSLLFLVITLLPGVVGLLFMQYQYVALVVFLYYALFGFAFHAFINVSYTNAVFDRFINARIEGARLNQGLRVEDDDEYDDEEGEEA